MAHLEDLTFISSDGIHRIHARKCIPNTTPRAVLQIAHGIAEHCARYDDFMTFMADHGFVCVANDHLGHGSSFTEEKDKGAFCETEGWFTVVNDMKKLHDLMVSDYPNLPYIIMGHSMGSFLTRTYLIQYPDSYDLCILSGTGQQSSAMVSAGLLMANLMVKTKGYYSDGQKLNDIAFGSYLNKIDHPRTGFDWLSANSENVDSYIADPLCGFTAKNGLYRDMMTGIRFISQRNNIAKVNKEKPIYLMSGKEDPVGDYGKGVEKAYRAYCDAGCKDVTMKLYEGGRHEMLNEFNHEAVYQDILNWIEDRL